MVVNHRMWVVVLLTLMLSVLVAQEAPAQRTDTEQRVEQDYYALRSILALFGGVR